MKSNRSPSKPGLPRPQLDSGSRDGQKRGVARSRKFWGVLLTVVVIAVSWAAWNLLPRRNHTPPAPGVDLVRSPAVPPPVSASNGAATDSLITSPVPAGTAPDKEGLVEWINRANQLLAQGQPAEALKLLEEAAKLSPEDEDVHYNLGIALSRLNRNEEALKEYQEALRIFPDYAEVHNNLGNLLVRMGKKEEAVAHFEEAVKLNPENASTWNNFGSALQQLGRTNEAQDHFQKAAQLDTNYWQAHFNLATSFLQRKQFAQARAGFETVVRLQPGFKPAQEALSRVQKELPPAPVSP